MVHTHMTKHFRFQQTHRLLWPRKPCSLCVREASGVKARLQRAAPWMRAAEGRPCPCSAPLRWLSSRLWTQGLGTWLLAGEGPDKEPWARRLSVSHVPSQQSLTRRDLNLGDWGSQASPARLPVPARAELVASERLHKYAPDSEVCAIVLPGRCMAPSNECDAPAMEGLPARKRGMHHLLLLGPGILSGALATTLPPQGHAQRPTLHVVKNTGGQRGLL